MVANYNDVPVWLRIDSSRFSTSAADTFYFDPQGWRYIYTATNVISGEQIIDTAAKMKSTFGMIGQIANYATGGFLLHGYYRVTREKQVF